MCAHASLFHTDIPLRVDANTTSTYTHADRMLVRKDRKDPKRIQDIVLLRTFYDGKRRRQNVKKHNFITIICIFPAIISITWGSRKTKVFLTTILIREFLLFAAYNCEFLLVVILSLEHNCLSSICRYIHTLCICNVHSTAYMLYTMRACPYVYMCNVAEVHYCCV